MIRTESIEAIEIDDEAALWAWLGANHQREDSVWLTTYKAHIAAKYLSREQVLDALVAHGWIDGIRRKLDDDRTMQLISPRRVEHWAKSYKDRAARLEAEGRMRPPGRASVAAGKASGLWSFMDDVDALIAPPDLIAALNAAPPARAHFEAAAPSYRRNVLRWIKLAKTKATRSKRLAKAADYAARDKRIPQM